MRSPPADGGSGGDAFGDRGWGRRTLDLVPPQPEARHGQPGRAGTWKPDLPPARYFGATRPHWRRPPRDLRNGTTGSDRRECLPPKASRAVKTAASVYCEQLLVRLRAMANSPRPIDRTLEWTGERCVPWIGEWQVLYEHLHRYFFAAAIDDSSRVLDLGCGEGYGSAILAEKAKHVVGVDVDARVIEHASANYPLDNLEFRQASVLELDDLADASFELVVCFEVIEHIAEHDELLSLVRRVLAPGGLFLVSTPDREVYSERDRYHNPYHVKEFEP